jgi:uncharacterized oligopeptide transporter (OPT) family protein
MSQMNFSSLNDLASSLGVGSIAMLAVFLFLDANTPIYALIESNAVSQSWAIFVAIPLVFIAYVAGVVSVAIGRYLRQMAVTSSSSQLEWSAVPQQRTELVMLNYQKYRQVIDTLDGAAIAFALLTVGVAFEAMAFRVPTIGVTLGLLCLFLCALCALIASRTEQDCQHFFRAVSKKSPPNSPP